METFVPRWIWLKNLAGFHFIFPDEIEWCPRRKMSGCRSYSPPFDLWKIWLSLCTRTCLTVWPSLSFDQNQTHDYAIMWVSRLPTPDTGCNLVEFCWLGIGMRRSKVRQGLCFAIGDWMPSSLPQDTSKMWNFMDDKMQGLLTNLDLNLLKYTYLHTKDYSV